jgi:hypothetical protein
LAAFSTMSLSRVLMREIPSRQGVSEHGASTLHFLGIYENKCLDIQ